MLTVDQVCTELKVARSTLNDWWARNRGPKRSRLPNGKLRIVRRDLDDWLDSCRVA
jgi:predicted DNA-binding transcriptional regulator AlpA